MTYIRDHTEYLEWDEYRVYNAIRYLNGQNRTTNNSQVANATGLSRPKVSTLTGHLKRRGYIKDVSRGAAYHWRTTGKQVEILERETS